MMPSIMQKIFCLLCNFVKLFGIGVYSALIGKDRSITKVCDLLNKPHTKKEAKIYAFSSIMRISNNNYNEEEKEYWKDYGKKIFDYSYSGGKNKSDIPEEILEDYLNTRKRNFEINKLYLEWQKEGLFDTLIFSKDDCAQYGLNVKEANNLQDLIIEKTKITENEYNKHLKGVWWMTAEDAYKLRVCIEMLNTTILR